MTRQDQVESDQLKTIQSIIKSTRIAMLTTVDDDGALHSHPMTVQEAEFDGDCWFLASDESETVRNLQVNSSVNLAYSGSSQWLSLAGTAAIVRDQAKKEELWNTFTDVWFANGDSDPSVILIHVMAESMQYWDSPGSIATLASMLKAKVTGTEPEAGDSASMDL